MGKLSQSKQILFFFYLLSFTFYYFWHNCLISFFLKNRSLRLQFQKQVQELKEKYNFVPHLSIVQVGEREDSSVYVRMKQQAAQKVISFIYEMFNVASQNN
jgi:hypothetical protein